MYGSIVISRPVARATSSDGAYLEAVTIDVLFIHPWSDRNSPARISPGIEGCDSSAAA